MQLSQPQVESPTRLEGGEDPMDKTSTIIATTFATTTTTRTTTSPTNTTYATATSNLKRQLNHHENLESHHNNHNRNHHHHLSDSKRPRHTSKSPTPELDEPASPSPPLDQQNADTHRYIIDIIKRLEGRDQNVQIIAFANKILGVENEIMKAYLFMARSAAHERMQDYNSALKDAKLAIRSQPSNPKCYIRAASALHASGFTAKALNCLEIARTKSPRPGHLVSIDRLEHKIRPSPITDLPTDIFVEIVSYLETHNLMVIRRVSKGWKLSLENAKAPWRHFDMRPTHSSVWTPAMLQRMVLRACQWSGNSLLSFRVESNSFLNFTAREALARSASSLRRFEFTGQHIDTLVDEFLIRCSRLEHLKLTTYWAARAPPAFELAHGELKCAKLKSLELDRMDSVKWSQDVVEMLDRVETLRFNKFAASPAHTFEWVVRVMSRARSTLRRFLIQEPWSKIGMCLPKDMVRFEPFKELVTMSELERSDGPLECFIRGNSALPYTTLDRIFHFPKLAALTAHFLSLEQWQRILASTPNLESLTYRISFLTDDHVRLSRQVGSWTKLKSLSVDFRYSQDHARALLESLTPSRDDPSVRCPELESIQFCNGPEMTGTTVVKMVLIRKKLSQGLSLEEILSRLKGSVGSVGVGYEDGRAYGRDKRGPFTTTARSLSETATTRGATKSHLLDQAIPETASEEDRREDHADTPSVPPCKEISRLIVDNWPAFDPSLEDHLRSLVPRASFGRTDLVTISKATGRRMHPW
ncbi:hypothetical protein IE53DRAFT_409714 [Violaceomyces palustris]|uniref:Uncharacterized protein n=1 Tax=Violaceomyces palustris TaxID=1673888 RepID=A0ACD0P1T5_9BASI|nr:hypothetical protein IE53DRAFT_409714 [Violaceomyces palustris]